MKGIADQMAAYAAYHRTPGNKAVHLVFVPLIVWSLMGLLSRPLGAVSGIEVSVGLLLTVGVLAYYLRLDYGLGVASTLLFTVLFVTARQVATLPGMVGPVPIGYAILGATFVVSWIAQILGHALIEHRKPALVDNVLQVFVAPIFVVAEVAFLLGWRRQLHADVEARLAATA